MERMCWVALVAGADIVGWGDGTRARAQHGRASRRASRSMERRSCQDEVVQGARLRRQFWCTVRRGQSGGKSPIQIARVSAKSQL